MPILFVVLLFLQVVHMFQYFCMIAVMTSATQYLKLQVFEVDLTRGQIISVYDFSLSHISFGFSTW